MPMSSCLKRLLIMVSLLLLTGCASSPGVALPTGTLMLGEVMHMLTRDMVNANEIGPGQRLEDLAQRLQARGLTDTQIDQGRVAVLRLQIYWNNTASGNRYSQLSPELLAEGVTVEPGNVVEFRVEEHGSTIRRVRSRSLAEGGCYYGDLPAGAVAEVVGALALVGPRGSASLYCAGIEKEGWQRPRTYWHRLPGATPSPPGAPAAAPPTPITAESAADVLVTANTMATLLIYRGRSQYRGAVDLPVWVDGEKAASLGAGTCDIVLVHPGDHVVVAGTGRGLIEFPRRELVVSVAAGERRVLEYRIDDAVLARAGAMAFFEAEKWSDLTHHFNQRPAVAGDACAIRHPPAILRGQAAPARDGQP